MDEDDTYNTKTYARKKKKQLFTIFNHDKNVNGTNQYKNKHGRVHNSNDLFRRNNIRHNNIDSYNHSNNNKKIPTQRRNSQNFGGNKSASRFDGRDKSFDKTQWNNKSQRFDNYKRGTRKNTVFYNQTSSTKTKIQYPDLLPRIRREGGIDVDRQNRPNYGRSKNYRLGNNNQKYRKNNRYATRITGVSSVKKYPYFYRKGKSNFKRDLYNFFRIKRPRFPKMVNHLHRSRKKKVGFFLQNPDRSSIQYPFKLNLNLINEHIT